LTGLPEQSPNTLKAEANLKLI